jgi:hypothetical protein
MAYDRSSMSFHDLGIIVLLVAPVRWLKPKVCFELPPADRKNKGPNCS